MRFILSSEEFYHLSKNLLEFLNPILHYRATKSKLRTSLSKKKKKEVKDLLDGFFIENALKTFALSF